MVKYDLPYGLLHLPEGCEDRSTYQFVSPAKGPEIPLAVGRGVRNSLALIGVSIIKASA